MIYLSGPYTHSNQNIVDMRYEIHRLSCAMLMLEGKHVFSPIVHGHVLLPELARWTHDDWIHWDLAYLKMCTEIKTIAIHGYVESKGCVIENAAARMIGLKGSIYLPVRGKAEWSHPFYDKLLRLINDHNQLYDDELARTQERRI